MEITRDEGENVGRRKKGKSTRPRGGVVDGAAKVARQTGALLEKRAEDWLERLSDDPALFGAIELEVHAAVRSQADLLVAGLLAQASRSPKIAERVEFVTAGAEAPLRSPEKKNAP